MNCPDCGAKVVVNYKGYLIYACGTGEEDGQAFRGEICQELVRLRAIVEPLKEMVAADTNVTVSGVKPSQDHFLVTVEWDYEGHVFTGPTLAEALSNANNARKDANHEPDC